MKPPESKLFMTSSSNKLTHALGRLLQNRHAGLWLYAGCALLISAQLLITTHTHPKQGWPTLYNNYVIFEQSFVHLWHGLDLYQAYPDNYYDLYKYSPAFAVLMAPFSILPDFIGLPLWSLLNALVLYLGVRKLSVISLKQQNLMLLFLLPELIISLQNAQSNALVAGLMILSLHFLEIRKAHWATLLLAIGTMIKLFPVLGFLLLLLYPRFWRSVAWTAFWILILLLLPMAITGWHSFMALYMSWFELLQADHSASTGLSIFAWLEAWFGAMPDKNILLGIGVLLLLASFIRPVFLKKNAADQYALLALLMIWTVIFNHKAESPTFIIAVAGVGLWYFSRKADAFTSSLLILTLVFVSLSPSDLMPAAWKNGWLKSGVWKAFPCILVWAVISFEQLSGRSLSGQLASRFQPLK